MALPSAIARLALTIVGPELVKALRKAAADPHTRKQVAALMTQIRSGVGESTPAGRARVKLLRDLDATVALTRGRIDGARDEAEREQALAWLHEAEDIRHTADIAAAVGKGGQKDVVEGLQNRRQALLLRMLEATVPDSSLLVDALFGTPGEADDEVRGQVETAQQSSDPPQSPPADAATS